MPETIDRRELVLGSVRTIPGSHLRALQRITRLPLGTLRYHLKFLVAKRDVLAERDRRFRRFYPADMRLDQRRVWDALRQRQTRDIVSILLQAPDSQSGLARRLDLASSSVHMYARRLKSLGLVDDEQGKLTLRDPGTVATVIESVDPCIFDVLTDGAIELFDDLEPRPRSRSDLVP